MENDEGKTLEKDDKIATSKQEGIQESTGRPDINVINKRNEEEDKQEKKESYTAIGGVALLIAIIIFAIYFFS